MIILIARNINTEDIVAKYAISFLYQLHNDTYYNNVLLSRLQMSLKDSEGRLRTKLHGKEDDFNLPIVNFPFICRNIPTVPACGVYISQLFQNL